MKSTLTTLLVLFLACELFAQAVELEPVAPGSLVRIQAEVAQEVRYHWMTIWPRRMDREVVHQGLVVFAAGCQPGTEYELARLGIPNDTSLPITEERFVVRVEGDPQPPGPQPPGPNPPPGPDPPGPNPPPEPQGCSLIPDGVFANLARRACERAPQSSPDEAWDIYRDLVVAFATASRTPEGFGSPIVSEADLRAYLILRWAGIQDAEWQEWRSWLDGEYTQHRRTASVSSLWDSIAFYATAASGIGEDLAVIRGRTACRVVDGRVHCD